MLAAAETRGFETRDVLTSLGVRRETVEDPDARLAGTAVLELWDALRTRCDDPTLQLAAPTALPFGAYRVIDYLVYASPTVGAGVSRFAEFFRLIAEGVSLSHTSPAGRLSLATTVFRSGGWLKLVSASSAILGLPGARPFWGVWDQPIVTIRRM